MSGTLNLIDQLLTLGRKLHGMHCHREALDVLGRLAAFQDLPVDVAEEAQVLLAEIHLRRRRHRRARRHLEVALLYRPDSARYHYLMAGTLNARSRPHPERAAEHYRRSLELEPDQPACLADFGLLTLKQGDVAGGLDQLRRAVELAPDEPGIVAKLVRGLRLAERIDEALAVLRAARFRNPRDGRFRRLYNDLMFRWLRRRQEDGRRAVPAAHGPTLLAFVRPTAEVAATAMDGKLVRMDEAALPSGPHVPLRPARRTDWKHG